jgi:hypothetical protein
MIKVRKSEDINEGETLERRENISNYRIERETEKGKGRR